MTLDEKQHMKEMALELANRPLLLVIIETSLFVVITLVALIGNICVLYVFYKTPRLRTATSYYIITLAISDIAMAVLVLPATIGVSACGCDAFGSLAGTIVQWILTELLFGSLQTTSLIAINRYFCVVRPSVYRKYFRPKLVILMIVGCWVINLVPTVAIYTSGLATIEFYASRYMRFPYFVGAHTGHVITAVYQVLFTIVPATLSIVCYWKIHLQIKNHKASLALHRNANGPSTVSVVALKRETSSTVVSNEPTLSSAVSNQPPSSSGESKQPSSVVSNLSLSAVVSNQVPSTSVESHQVPSTSVASNHISSLSVAPSHGTSSQIASASSSTLSSSQVVPNRTAIAPNRTLSVSVEEIKLTKSLMVIVIGFCVCWFPSATILHLSTYVRLPRRVEAILAYCGFTSSAINPILYNIYNRPFRRRARQLLRPRNVVSEDNKDSIRSIKRPGARSTIHTTLNLTSVSS